MSPILHNLSLLNDINLVSTLYSGESVRYGDGGAAYLGSLQGILHNLGRSRTIILIMFSVYDLPSHSLCPVQRLPHPEVKCVDS